MPPRTRLVVCLMCSIVPAVPAVPPAASAESAPARALIKRINAERKRQGVAPLRHSPALSSSSARFARRQMRTNRFGHADRIRASGFRRLGEVLSVQSGWRLRSAPVVRGWLSCSVHRSLVTSSSFGYMGVGWSRGHLGGGAATIWTVQLGSR